MRSVEIELALANHLGYRRNLIVPNVFWGFDLKYEADLLVVTKNHYCWEIEIKVTISDLKAEKNKSYRAHCSNRIKRLYFAVPDAMATEAMGFIPERAGLFSVSEGGYVRALKPPKLNKSARALTQEEINKLYELSAMRIWSLKRALFQRSLSRITKSSEAKGEK